MRRPGRERRPALLDAVDLEVLEGKVHEAYALLALVAGQDVEPSE